MSLLCALLCVTLATPGVATWTSDAVSELLPNNMVLESNAAVALSDGSLVLLGPDQSGTSTVLKSGYGGFSGWSVVEATGPRWSKRHGLLAVRLVGDALLVTGGQSYFTATPYVSQYRSDDGGASWKSVTPSGGPGLHGAKWGFVGMAASPCNIGDTCSVYLVTEKTSSRVWRGTFTSAAGSKGTWVQISSPTASWNAGRGPALVAFAADLLMAVDDAGRSYLTQNSGSSWSLRSSSFPASTLARGVRQGSNAGSALVVTSTGAAYRTTWYGQSWTAAGRVSTSNTFVEWVATLPDSGSSPARAAIVAGSDSTIAWLCADGGSCSLCPVGTGCRGAGCPTGTYEPSTCVPCHAGEYSGSLTDACRPCPSGTSSDSDEAGSCASCTAGRYSSLDRQRCDPCNQGETSGFRAGSCTKCPTGTRWVSTTTCEPCPPGTDATEPGSLVCTGCPDPERCTEGGECKPGYTGVLCTTCASGYYGILNECAACPDLPWLSAVIGGGVVVAVAAMSLLGWVTPGRLRTFRELATYLQLMTAALSINFLYMPEFVKACMQWLQVVWDSVGVYSLQCSVDLSWYDSLVFTLGGVGGVLAFLLVMTAALSCGKCCAARQGNAAATARYVTRRKAVGHLTTTVVLLSVVPVCRKLAESMQCLRSADGSDRLLLADTRISCNSRFHTAVQVACVSGMGLLAVVLPLIIGTSLQCRYKRGSLHRAAFRGMTVAYKAHLPYTEAWRLSYQALVASTIVLFSLAPDRQCAVQLGLATAYALTILIARPWVRVGRTLLCFRLRDATNVLLAVGAVAQVVVLGCGFLARFTTTAGGRTSALTEAAAFGAGLVFAATTALQLVATAQAAWVERRGPKLSPGDPDYEAEVRRRYWAGDRARALQMLARLQRHRETQLEADRARLSTLRRGGATGGTDGDGKGSVGIEMAELQASVAATEARVRVKRHNTTLALETCLGAFTRRVGEQRVAAASAVSALATPAPSLGAPAGERLLASIRQLQAGPRGLAAQRRAALRTMEQRFVAGLQLKSAAEVAHALEGLVAVERSEPPSAAEAAAADAVRCRLRAVLQAAADASATERRLLAHHCGHGRPLVQPTAAAAVAGAGTGAGTGDGNGKGRGSGTESDTAANSAAELRQLLASARSVAAQPQGNLPAGLYAARAGAGDAWGVAAVLEACMDPRGLLLPRPEHAAAAASPAGASGDRSGRSGPGSGRHGGRGGGGSRRGAGARSMMAAEQHVVNPLLALQGGGGESKSGASGAGSADGGGDDMDGALAAVPFTRLASRERRISAAVEAATSAVATARSEVVRALRGAADGGRPGLTATRLRPAVAAHLRRAEEEWRVLGRDVWWCSAAPVRVAVYLLRLAARSMDEAAVAAAVASLRSSGAGAADATASTAEKLMEGQYNSSGSCA